MHIFAIKYFFWKWYEHFWLSEENMSAYEKRMHMRNDTVKNCWQNLFSQYKSLADGFTITKRANKEQTMTLTLTIRICSAQEVRRLYRRTHGGLWEAAAESIASLLSQSAEHREYTSYKFTLRGAPSEHALRVEFVDGSIQEQTFSISPPPVSSSLSSHREVSIDWHL